MERSRQSQRLHLQDRQRFNSLQTGRSMESRTTQREAGTSSEAAFQFPSNGKEHGKNPPHLHRICFSKFQFPSNGKEHGKIPEAIPGCTVAMNGFNSLQTGRSMERQRYNGRHLCPSRKFQFPSNGKEHGKPQTKV